MSKNFRIAFLFLFLVAFFPGRAYPFSFLLENEKITISAANQKKIDKAEKEIQKSAEIMKEADKYYAELATKQADLTAEESDKLNDKALGKQIEALKMQQSGNKKKFDVYSEITIDFWKKYMGNPDEMGYPKSLENEARNNFQSSQDQLKEAGETKDKLLAYSKMSTAAEALSKAVETIKKAIDVYLATQLKPTTTTQPIAAAPLANRTDSILKPKDNQIRVDTLPKTNVQKTEILNHQKADTMDKNAVQQTLPLPSEPIKDTSNNKNIVISTDHPETPKSNIYREVNINEELKSRFNKFIRDSFPNDYEKYLIDFSTINNGDIDAIKAAWNRYIHEKYPISSLIKTAQKPFKIGLSESRFKGEQNEIKIIDTTKLKGFVYKVQVVASRVPLSAEMLKEIYNGPETAEVSLEDEWYKYSINCGNDYNKACGLLKNIYIKGAFIPIYKDGERMNIKDNHK